VKKSQYTEELIAYALQQAEHGAPKVIANNNYLSSDLTAYHPKTVTEPNMPTVNTYTL